MAGLPWFEMDVDFPDHQKSVRLGIILGNDLAFGYVVRLFAYCYRHATDRFPGPRDVAATSLERAADFRATSGAFVAAALEVGYVDPSEDGGLIVHGVGERLGPHLAKRERDRARAKERRSEVTQGIGVNSPRDVAATSTRRSRDVRGDRDKDRDSDRDQQKPIASVQPQIVSVISGGAGGEA